jgi:ferric-dicitrate binding protein FerR (iron transport regulator)
MQENYLAKWLNNELTEEELAAFKKTPEFSSYERLLEASKNLSGPNYDVEKALLALNENKSRRKDRKVVPLFPIRRYLRIAAVVLLLCTASFLYYNALDKTLTTAYAERADFILPDASEVTLNADSKIVYPKKNWDQERNLQLEGEAFFKVAKGKRFTVSTKNGLVTVLGTHFNVKSRSGFFEITCYEGLVSVTHKGQITKLPAGASFLVIHNKVRTAKHSSAAEPSWLFNESSFKSIPLSFVLAEFQRQFNKTVETHNIDENQLFTGSFSNTNLNLALQSISVPSQINFKLEGNKVLFYAQSAP